ncbi:MAG TPA: glutathione S-transferase family protein [Sphingomonadaceae bacterium]
MLELYHFGPVANSLTPLLCLLEKEIPFENKFLNSRLWEHHTPEFQRLSPEGMVPILVHDGRVVRESTVINEYIDSVWPEIPLRPADPWLRAEMRVLTKYVDEYFCPALTVIGAHGATPFASKIDKQEMARILARMPNEEVRRKWQTVSHAGYSEEQLADARRRLGAGVRRIEQQLAHGRDWLLGEEYSLADIKWYSMAPALPRVVPELCNGTDTPAVLAWLGRMQARPAVAALEHYRPG